MCARGESVCVCVCECQVSVCVCVLCARGECVYCVQSCLYQSSFSVLEVTIIQDECIVCVPLSVFDMATSQHTLVHHLSAT